MHANTRTAPQPDPKALAQVQGQLLSTSPAKAPRSAQRLDVLHRQHACRVRRPRAMRVMARFRRFSNSLFLEWRSRQKKPHHKTSSDFFGAMNTEHYRYALRCLQARQPSLPTPS